MRRPWHIWTGRSCGICGKSGLGRGCDDAFRYRDDLRDCMLGGSYVEHEIMVMTHEIATVLCGGPGLKLPSLLPVLYYDNHDNGHSPCHAYQTVLVRSTADVIIYIHDDVTIRDPGWLQRVLAPFERDEVV